MLKSLFIENYALIDELKVEFDKGFSVLTGETGAGKSIILGALSLILGERAESKFIKQNENKCTIEGVFNISVYGLQSLFEKSDWVSALILQAIFKILKLIIIYCSYDFTLTC